MIVRYPDGQPDPGKFELCLTGSQESPADALVLIAGIHTDGGDPAEAVGVVHVPCYEADHAPIFYRFKPDNIGECQNSDQVEHRPRIFFETGALELVPLVTVQNLAHGLEELRAHGFLLVGLDSTGDADLSAVALRAPLALVLGAEGKGLRQLTKQTCDSVARIDVPGEIKSLNVSNAAALALYVASRQLQSTL